MIRLHPPARLAVVTIAMAASACFLAGCGEKTTPLNTDPEARLVSNLVEEFNEFSTDGKAAAKLFAAGSMPKPPEFARYGRYSYLTTGKAIPSGDAATMTITIRDSTTGAESSGVEWKFKKEDNRWKIAAAPLP